MAAVPNVNISGLREGVLLFAKRYSPCRVFVAAVELRQAPALLELLTKATRVPPGWIIPRDKKLRQLSRLANELVIVEKVVLPLLTVDAADLDGVRLLHQYGWSIRHIARHVDKPVGPYFLAAADASSLVLDLHGHLKSAVHNVEFVRKNLEDVRVMIGDFKQFVVRFPGEDEEGDQV